MVVTCIIVTISDDVVYKLCRASIEERQMQSKDWDRKKGIKKWKEVESIYSINVILSLLLVACGDKKEQKYREKIL